MDRTSSPQGSRQAFTLLEVALIVAIIGMMLMIIGGYLFAPKRPAQLPPVNAMTPVPPDSAPAAAAVPAKPTPAAPSPTPRLIELAPPEAPALR